MFVTNCYNRMTITRDAMTLHWTLPPSLPPLSGTTFHYQRESSCTHACTADSMEIQQVERRSTAPNKFKGNCYCFVEWEVVTSCRFFKFNERAPTSQSCRGHGHTLSLSLCTYTRSPSFNQLHPTLQFQSFTRQACRLQNNHYLHMPTFWGVGNTSKHSIQFSAVQMLNARMFGNEMRGGGELLSERISSHHAQDWAKSY
jgi:hypothetical protein